MLEIKRFFFFFSVEKEYVHIGLHVLSSLIFINTVRKTSVSCRAALGLEMILTSILQ